jgi:hypothetical protein
MSASQNVKTFEGIEKEFTEISDFQFSQRCTFGFCLT